MPKNETFRRYFVFLISLFFTGVGIAFVRHSGIGVTPISSVANVMSVAYTNVSFGMWLMMWNFLLILIQILILRRDFDKIQLLQIPLSVIFGFFTDLGGIIANRFPVESYYFQWMSTLIGTVILSFGISIAVIANVVMNSGDAAVKAISDKTGIAYGNVKIAFDVVSVLLSVILSLLWFREIIGTREGTVFAAIFTGVFVKMMIPNIKNDLEKWMKAENDNPNLR